MAGTTYSYTVQARDAAGNISPLSNSATVTTAAPGGQSVTFAAIDDSRVQQADPTTNYGSGTTLGADQDAASQIESYLKFTIAGLPVGATVTSAKLRLTTNAADVNSATGNGPRVYQVNDQTWTETGVNWNNKPARASTLTADTGSLAPGQTVNYDVTSLVNGNSTVSFGLIPDSTDGTSFYSDENATTSGRPELVITYTTGAPPGPSATFAAIADSRVLQASPTTNYGTATTLGADQDGVAQIESYLKFTVAGLPAGATVTSAELRLTTNAADVNSATANGPRVYEVNDQSWTESGVNWNNKPARASTLTADTGALAPGQTVKYDVTSLVTGNSTVSFAVIPDSTDGTSFYSDENATTTGRPQLFITYS
jgi:chondroitin AC lyase